MLSEKSLEITEMFFYTRMLRKPWTEHLSNEKILKKIVTKCSFIFRIRKSRLKFSGHLMKKECLENLKRRKHKWDKQVRDSKKVEVTWKKQILLRSRKNRKTWRGMIAKVLKKYGSFQPISPQKQAVKALEHRRLLVVE